jgi:hypothetical protein
MRLRAAIVVSVAVSGLALAACSTAEPSLRVTSPRDGEQVTSPVRVEVSLRDFELRIAGSFSEGKGHLHILVDVGCVETGRTIPSGEGYVHLWRGEPSGEVELEPGEHTLCVQAGDGTHVALDLSDQVTIDVVE